MSIRHILSFRQLVTVDNGGHVVVTSEGGSTIAQPSDLTLVVLEYLPGSGANVSSVTIGSSQHAYSALINPALDGLGDNGDIGSASAAIAGNTKNV